MRMQSLMRAIAKALSKLLGPAGFPAEFAISLYDDEQTEKRFAELMDKLSGSYNLSNEAIEEIFSVKRTTEILHKHLLKCFYIVLNILVENRNQLKLLVEQRFKSVSEDRMSDVILPLISHDGDRFAKEGIVTEQMLIEQLTYLYADSDLFLAVVLPAGFPQGIISNHTSPKVAYWNFVTAFRGLEQENQTAVSKALSRDKPGSDIIKTWAAYFSS